MCKVLDAGCGIPPCLSLWGCEPGSVKEEEAGYPEILDPGGR